MPGKRGDPRLARLRTLVGRAVERVASRVGELRVAHDALLDLARRLEPTADSATGRPPTGAMVRARVDALLDELTARCAGVATHAGAIATWLRPKVAYLVTVLRRLGSSAARGLYHGDDVPGLPRTDNDMEQCSRRLKTEQRRITGRQRADAFVVRVGGFAVYATATAASTIAEATLRAQLSAVPADQWQAERVTLRANQDRQAKMRRFRLRRDAYLADLEARWTVLAQPP